MISNHRCPKTAYWGNVLEFFGSCSISRFPEHEFSFCFRSLVVDPRFVPRNYSLQISVPLLFIPRQKSKCWSYSFCSIVVPICDEAPISRILLLFKLFWQYFVNGFTTYLDVGILFCNFNRRPTVKKGAVHSMATISSLTACAGQPDLASSCNSVRPALKKRIYMYTLDLFMLVISHTRDITWREFRSLTPSYFHIQKSYYSSLLGGRWTWIPVSSPRLPSTCTIYRTAERKNFHTNSYIGYLTNHEPPQRRVRGRWYRKMGEKIYCSFFQRMEWRFLFTTSPKFPGRKILVAPLGKYTEEKIYLDRFQ